MNMETLLEEMTFAGIGARKTPIHLRFRIEDLAISLSRKNWKLRSGSAIGGDTFFENGFDRARGRKEIIVPFDGYGGRYFPNVFFPSKDTLDQSLEIAEQFDIEDWKSRTKNVKLLLARNVNIILGMDFKSPVKFAVCWTENGQERGGTGHAIRLCHAHGIPVVNMGEPFMRHANAVEKEVVTITRPYDKQMSTLMDKVRENNLVEA